MAFQTSFFRDGEWVTETVNLQSALRQATAAAAPSPAVELHPDPPFLGVLSRTIVESPVVHRVLPVRLRSKIHNDIAFIGDRFVQISELRGDGQVHEVAQKADFGSRIRNAAVLGDSLEHGLDDDPGSFIKPEADGPAFMIDAPDVPCGSRYWLLPPQLLVLMLDSGDTVFLFLKDRAGTAPEFVLNTYTLPRKVPYLGHHLAVDPSSRYMASASPEGVLVVFELEEMNTLNAQYMARGTCLPVKSVRLRLIQGVVHKLAFLHPRPEDDYHIILILIVIRRERSRGDPTTRMIIYEWEMGDSLKEVLAEEKTGNRLPQEHKMPLLLIPLRFSTTFFTVSEESIGVVKHCLSGSPVFESLCADPPAQTMLHHGAHNPLWTAWARPFRRQKYFERTDIIYLAREDGAIIHIEIEAVDLVPSVTNVGCLGTNINTAFSTAYDIYSDIMIIGGDAGPGGIWKLAPRTDLEQVSVLANWSPVVDVAAAGGCPAGVPASTGSHTANARQGTPNRAMEKPEAIFTASGRGVKGSVTQWRWGFQGRIGLDIESGNLIRHSWAFALPNRWRSSSLCALLALPYSSALLRFSGDLSEVVASSAEDTLFDLTARTLDACLSQRGVVFQVTEQSVIVSMDPESGASCRYSLDEILQIDNAVAGNACCTDDAIVISSYCNTGSRLHLLLATPTGVQYGCTWEARGDITCVSLFVVAESKFVIAGSVMGGTPWISIYTLTGEMVASEAIANHNGTATPEYFQFESLTSICLVHKNAAGEAYFAAGTRCGHLVTMRITARGSPRITLTAETIGVAPAEVFPVSASFKATAAMLVCCDNALITMTDFSPQDNKFHGKHFVWLTDAYDSSMPSPAVHSVCSLTQNISGHQGHMSLLVQAGSRLLLAESWPRVGLVPRSIPLEGTPTRVIYSHTWNCLVVALLKGDKPTLAFIDPESGEMISAPTDKDGKSVEFITGLGHSGDRIYCLHEWLYVKDGKTFAFILVATKGGRLLIVSVGTRKRERLTRRLFYWTRYKRALGQPVYSVVSDDQGIIYCADKTIRWEVLDLAEKRLRLMSEHELDSPATSLCVVRGHLFALTIMHSLEVIDYKTKRSGGMTLAHSDCVSRSAIHMIDAGDTADGHCKGPVTLLSDQAGGIAGIWVPWRQRSKEFDVVFEAVLPTSVRRFVRTRSRPRWLMEGRRRRLETVANTEDGTDILGVSLDGSLRHFTLLGLDLWRFLRLIQNMARRCPDICPLAELEAANEQEGGFEHETDEDLRTGLEPKRHSKGLQIDGDMLERCLRRRALEKMLRKWDMFALFCEFLDKLQGGRYTRSLQDERVPKHERHEGYIRLGYEILTSLFDPVM